jgi:hypothetical protein
MRTSLLVGLVSTVIVLGRDEAGLPHQVDGVGFAGRVRVVSASICWRSVKQLDGHALVVSGSAPACSRSYSSSRRTLVRPASSVVTLSFPLRIHT